MTLVFAFVAGLLSILSPCFLPLVPVVISGAAAENRFAPFALAASLAISVAGIGIFVATVGFSIGLVLMVPAFQIRLATAAGPAGDWAQRRFGGFGTGGTRGQFALGLLLGAVWTPCVGPTLGAASVMASRGENLLQVATTMIVFGVGTALPLLVFGTLSRELLMRWRGRTMGLLLILSGIAILTGTDRTLQIELERLSPAWLTAITTRI
jgi:cytochrome c-type biogenesis protein